MTPALSLPLAGLALALTGAAGAGVVGVGVVVGVLVLALTLPEAARLPRPRAAASVIGVVGMAAAASAAVEGFRDGGQPGSLRVALPVLAFTFAAGVLGQILRRDGRHDLVVALSITCAAATVAALGSLWIPLSRTVVAEGALVGSGLGIAAVGVVVLIIERMALTGVRLDVAMGGAVAGAGLAASGATLFIEPGVWSAVELAVVGVVAGAVALVVHVAAIRLVEERVSIARVGARPHEPGTSSAELTDTSRVRGTGMSADPHELALLAAAALAVLLPAGSVYTAARILVG